MLRIEAQRRHGYGIGRKFWQSLGKYRIRGEECYGRRLVATLKTVMKGHGSDDELGKTWLR